MTLFLFWAPWGFLVQVHCLLRVKVKFIYYLLGSHGLISE